MNPPKSLYLDTNVVLNYFLFEESAGTDGQTSLARNVFDRCVEKRYEIVVSGLAVAEFISSCSRIIAKSNQAKKIVDPARLQEYITYKRNLLLKRSLEMMYSQPNISLMPGTGDISGGIFEDSVPIMIGTPATTDGRVVKKLDAADALHLLLADRLGCTHFCTFDKMFGHTGYRPGSGMKIIVLDGSRPQDALDAI